MTEQVPQSKTLGIVSIVLGAVSFIPLIGLFTGIAAIIIGIIAIKNKNKRGIIGLILGILGFLLTFGLYGSLFYFGCIKRGGVYDDMRFQIVSERSLPDAINAIETYKVRFGEYPNKIEDIDKLSNNLSVVIDQIQMFQQSFKLGGNKNLYFYYQNNGNTYYLFSRGIDGQPFTKDDIFPIINGDLGNIGYTDP